MNANVIGLIIAGVLFAVPVAIVVGVVLVIRRKIKKFEKESGLDLSMDNFIKDLGESEGSDSSPLSLNGMDRIYLPKIHEEFPDFQIASVVPQVETVLKEYLNSIEIKSTSALKKLTISPSLVDRVESIIEDLNSRELKVNYDNVVIHRTVISEYVHENGMVIIRFQSAVGYLNFSQDENGKLVSGSKEKTRETVYVVSYARVLDSDLARQAGVTDVMGLNCPNCGAPLSSANAEKCLFCGTPFKNMTNDVFGWSFTDIKEKNRMTKKLY